MISSMFFVPIWVTSFHYTSKRTTLLYIFQAHPQPNASSSSSAKMPTTTLTRAIRSSPKWRSWSARATRWNGRRPLAGSSSKRTWKRAATAGRSLMLPHSHYTPSSNCAASSSTAPWCWIWMLRTWSR